MLRSLLKTGAAGALSWTGADRLLGALSGARYLPLIVGYHQVVERFQEPDGSFIPAMRVTRRMFERHLDWIGRSFRLISLDELGARLEEGRPFDRPVAAVTFDDGYSDAYHYAFPILKRKGIPAAFFVVTDLIDTSRLQIYDQLYLLLTRAFTRAESMRAELARVLRRLDLWRPEMERTIQGMTDAVAAMEFLFGELPQEKVRRVVGALAPEADVPGEAPEELRPLAWEMLAEMQRDGMTIGSHTRTHAVLANEPLPVLYDEILGSRQALERKLGSTVAHFAYPNGRFNAAAVAAVAVSGYRFGYTTCLHRDPGYPLLTIPRIILWENSCLDVLGRFSSAIMSCHTHRVFDLVTSCTLDHGGPRPPSWSWREPVSSYGCDAVQS